MLESEHELELCDAFTVARSGKTARITSRKHAAVDDRLTIRWRAR